MGTESRTASGRLNGRMPTTRTGLVRTAQQGDAPERAQAALAELCLVYWKPIHAFVRCRRNASEAADLTQEFMAELLSYGVRTYDPEFGGQPRRFRTWLLAAVIRFLNRQRQRDHASKRDARNTQSLDALLTHAGSPIELPCSTPPERAFTRSFAACLIDRAWNTTREWYVARGQAERFDLLERFIPSDELDDFRYEPIADTLGVSAVAVRRAVMDLRRRYRANLRRHVRETVAGEDDIDDELRFLFRAEDEPNRDDDGL